MAGRSDYSVLVGQAEKAVGSVKDPELKRAAFEKILEDLLARKGTTGTTEPVKVPRRHEAPASKARIAPKTVHAPRGGPQAYVEELVEEAFFKKPKTITQVKAELSCCH